LNYANYYLVVYSDHSVVLIKYLVERPFNIEYKSGIKLPIGLKSKSFTN